MMLIVVARSRVAAFDQLTREFSEEPTVRVIFDRRFSDRRRKPEPHTPDRRQLDRRRPEDSLDGRDYIVVRTGPNAPPQLVL